MRRLLLVRHGETDFNRERRFQGHIDTPLNASGLAQARAIGQRLSTWPIVYCGASDLARAATTAAEIARHHDVEVELLAGLREAHLGVLQGELIHEFGRILGDESEYLAQRSPHARPPEGESPMDVRRRVQKVVRALAAREAELPPGDLVLVAHGGSLRALAAVLLGLPPAAGWVFGFDNCSLTTIEWHPGGRSMLRAHNDCGHLAG